ncbi:hypothetical protein D3C86_1526840 [compost metagenome]
MKATQGDGIPLFDSGRKFPVPSISLQPIIPKSVLVRAKARIFSNVSSATTVSGFNIQTYFPLALSTPILLPLGKPTFSLFSIKITSGKRSFII